jgi:hypothetical protein
MTTSGSAPIDAGEFVRWWISQHIGTGSQLSDASTLAKSLAADGEQMGIDEEVLEQAAGKPLREAIEAAIKRAIEEGLL